MAPTKTTSEAQATTILNEQSALYPRWAPQLGYTLGYTSAVGVAAMSGLWGPVRQVLLSKPRNLAKAGQWATNRIGVERWRRDHMVCWINSVRLLGTISNILRTFKGGV